MDCYSTSINRVKIDVDITAALVSHPPTFFEGPNETFYIDILKLIPYLLGIFHLKLYIGTKTFSVYLCWGGQDSAGVIESR